MTAQFTEKNVEFNGEFWLTPGIWLSGYVLWWALPFPSHILISSIFSMDYEAILTASVFYTWVMLPLTLTLFGKAMHWYSDKLNQVVGRNGRLWLTLQWLEKELKRVLIVIEERCVVQFSRWPQTCCQTHVSIPHTKHCTFRIKWQTCIFQHRIYCFITEGLWKHLFNEWNKI
jgi:hypothetical protein